MIRYCLILLSCLSTFPIFAQPSYEILVSSRATNSVKVWNLNGNFLGDLVASGSGGLSLTEDIIFHPDGSMLVSGYGSSAIKRYNALDGTYLGDFTQGYTLVNPSKMSIGPDSLVYVTQWGGTQKVVRFNLNGNFVDEFTQTSVNNGLTHFWRDSTFFIAEYADGNNGLIRHYDKNGNDLGPFHGSAKMDGPTTIWEDEHQTMFIADWTQGLVIHFDSAKNYLGGFIDNNLLQPEGLAFGPNGEYLIGDWQYDKVQMFDSLGTYLYEAAVGSGLQDPNAVRIRPSTGLGLEDLEGFSWNHFIDADFNLNLRFDEPLVQDLNLRILDLQGRLINVEIIAKNQKQFSLDLSGIPSGNYVLSLANKTFKDSAPIQLIRF